MPFICPVCAYPDLQEPPENFSICPSCGTEFGLDDANTTHDELRKQWILSGMHWFNERVPIPIDWNPDRQLFEGGYHISVSNSIATISAGTRITPEVATRPEEPSIAIHVSEEAPLRFGVRSAAGYSRGELRRA
jgi:hypothetical protein